MFEENLHKLNHIEPGHFVTLVLLWTIDRDGPR